jgi:hypothetical protein
MRDVEFERLKEGGQRKAGTGVVFSKLCALSIKIKIAVQK